MRFKIKIVEGIGYFEISDVENSPELTGNFEFV